MKAVRIVKAGEAAVVKDANIPKLRPDSLLVKTIAVALNPTDFQHINYVDTPAIVGCDFSGIVEEVGSAVTRSFQKGDRVWGVVHGSNVLNLESGAFAEYLLARGDLTMRIPEYMSFEEAATGGVAIVTVGQGLYQLMGLPWPDKTLKEKQPIFIYGGSSATGAIGIQFAKLSGFEVITACSPPNFDYVTALGADKVFDVNDPGLGAEVRAYTNNKLYYTWDCINDSKTNVCDDALSSSAPEGQVLRRGSIANFEDGNREDVTYTVNLGYTALGDDVEMFGNKWPADKEDFRYMVKWTEFAAKLLEEGKWKMHRFEAREGGFDRILQGLKDMQEGRVRGVKLVYRVDG